VSLTPTNGRAGAVDVVVIGAGHSGLAASYCLAAKSIDHIVLERGEVANTWRTERWDSLRLLTPNWMSCLPGYGYDDDDPDGYMSMDDVVDFISGYAFRSGAPVRTRTTVLRVTAEGDSDRVRYRVSTDRGDYVCRALVLATGAFNKPFVPPIAGQLPAHVEQFTPHDYRNPSDLPDGGVLVVGGSATGLQLADEIQQSGRDVTLAVGEHVRMPRLYRGRDIQWWMLSSGLLDDRIEDVDDPVRVRRLPSPQLVGTPERTTLDLNALQDLGVSTVGRLMGVRSGQAMFSGSFANVCKLADLKMNRMLAGFDEWAERSGATADVGPVERFRETRSNASAGRRIELTDGSVRSVVWATGCTPDYSWLDVPVLDSKHRLVHDRGVIAPGLFAMGLPFMRRRKSTFMHGAGSDARAISDRVAWHLDACARPTTSRIAV